MKKLVLCLLLITACSNSAAIPADATQGEIDMAAAMNISVEELRNQTPEEHMKAMQEMMK
jgi:hypothetical protein